MIARGRLLGDLKLAVTALEDDIRARVAQEDDLAEHLRAEHAAAAAAERTAMALSEWQEGEITQAAVAWVLACVFVRFLEDNGLIDAPMLSGPDDRRTAALGYYEAWVSAHPTEGDREFLEHVFTTAARFPAVAPLYDARHNPLWRLGPTHDGAKALREQWAAIDPDTGHLLHDFTDPGLDTRFLGDLYQDLSEAAKKRYALLQTPVFVEQFILDRTLDPALAEFGLDQVRMIDPTCGSGHFLIGAFQRLFAQWQDREPGTPTPVLAQKALDAVYGVDLNPYATAIARFRLLITALAACGVHRLAEAPAFTLNLATGDSLLHGAAPGQLFGGAAAHREGIKHVFETEDSPELQRIFSQGYHVVVGNPPYIAVQDSALRDQYRERYASCHGAYVLTVPFMERFFELARVDRGVGYGELHGFVGKITGNNFMKREFGVPLVERYLKSVDLQTVIDTSGAHIPGHGTPTVMLFGRSRPPVGPVLRVLDGIRGEPKQPDDPASGLVWAEIKALVDTPGTGGRFIRSSEVARTELSTHPMTLGIGRSLKLVLESAATRRLSVVVHDMGFAAVTREDEVFDRTQATLTRLAVPDAYRKALVPGEHVRDWSISTTRASLWPYDPVELVGTIDAVTERMLWPYRLTLSDRVAYGRTQLERGLKWFEYSMFFEKRFLGSTITWGEVATHNHFVLDRGGKVFKQTAPVIKLPEGTDEDQHLALLGVLNSSVACFWLKQVCHGKGGGGIGGGIAEEGWEQFFQLNSTKVRELPLPHHFSLELARSLDQLASERASLLGHLSASPLREHLATLRAREDDLLARMISLQEELDWQMLAAYDLVSADLAGPDNGAPPILLGQRAFEIVLARQVAAGETETTWFERHGSTPITEVPNEWPAEYRNLVQQRVALIEADADIALIERPENKRRWAGRAWADRQTDALRTLVLDALEAPEVWDAGELRSASQLADTLRAHPQYVEALEILATDRETDIGATVTRLVTEAAVPHLAALRLKDSGLRKRATWESVWDMQRAEDTIDARCALPEGDPQRLTKHQADALRAEEVGPIPVPPRYGQPDFRSATAWKHRGKLDVPKERFVFYPDAGRGADTSPVVGWAGWDELARARALAARIIELRESEAADASHLTPLLAGLAELLPWIHQWHPDVDPAYGGTPGAFFDAWLNQQLAELSLTHEVLRAWRPPPPTRGRRRTT
ncbi:DNA methyltransferase [Paraconexibacter sp. AEG42_29]|uniref:site-specific DNA-methyltransferase (adenine-specific) n=1 Tax=Paraconexibacter sp. AEG42_29 TaxID=2997339 RepID=A0AAU7B1I0_9ACTN